MYIYMHSNNVVCYMYYAFMWDTRNESDCQCFMQSWELTSVPLGHCQCIEMDQELFFKQQLESKTCVLHIKHIKYKSTIKELESIQTAFKTNSLQYHYNSKLVIHVYNNEAQLDSSHITASAVCILSTGVFLSSASKEHFRKSRNDIRSCSSKKEEGSFI